MTDSSGSQSHFRNAARIIVVSSVMFTFISYWRTAAVVLCDLASTVYYIGGIVESSIGSAAPWFILAVMIFSYAVRSVYIESCSLFVRGGVYRVVKEAVGGTLGKFSVSALMFDYVLTGPISAVSAGQYIMGLLLQMMRLVAPEISELSGLTSEAEDSVKRWGAVLLAIVVTVYFYRQNLFGIHESSDKALKIMIATTVMAIIMIAWCVVTLVVNGPANDVPWRPDLSPKWEHEEALQVNVNASRTYRLESKANVKSVHVDDPSLIEVAASAEKPDHVQINGLSEGHAKITLVDVDGKSESFAVTVLRAGSERFTEEEDKIWIAHSKRSDRLYPELDDNGEPKRKLNEGLKQVGIEAQEDPLGFLAPWGDALRGIAIFGLMLAFAHSILAMSGEETLAQVYREVESPKLANFKKAALIVFIYSIILTAGISFLAVLLIPDEVRMKYYAENLISGLARHVIGPPTLKLFLEAFVVIVGFLILSGAVNTSIIGSNGVLNRIAEDGVLPDWVLKPHPRYGTTYRLLIAITAMQIAVILLSQGNMIILGEAYAFGVVWSFTFKAMAMVVLRFRDPRPREYKVPFNPRIGSLELPLGLITIFLILLMTALLNFFTKPVATVGGVTFALVFFVIFLLSERRHHAKQSGSEHKHLEQFNQASEESISPQSLNLTRPYRKLIAIRSTQNLFMLEKALSDSDPGITDVVVMTAKVSPKGEANPDPKQLDNYDQALMTAVVERAETLGKQVHPLVVPTNNPIYALLRTAKDLGVNELVIGASNVFTADEQLDQVALVWINLHDGNTAPLTVRILSKDRDLHFDLGGGNRIPRVGESKARSVSDLRHAGVGADRMLLVQFDTRSGLDIFESILTTLDPEVELKVLVIPPENEEAAAHASQYIADQAEQIDRKVVVESMAKPNGDDIVRQARDGGFDLIVLPLVDEMDRTRPLTLFPWMQHVLLHSRCRVLLVANPILPKELAE